MSFKIRQRISAVIISISLLVGNLGFVSQLFTRSVSAGAVSASQTTSLTPTARDLTLSDTDQLGDWVGKTIGEIHDAGRSTIDFSSSYNWGQGGVGANIWDAMTTWDDSSGMFCSAVTSITNLTVNIPVTSHSTDVLDDRLKTFVKDPSNPYVPVDGNFDHVETTADYNPFGPMAVNLLVIHSTAYDPGNAAPFVATYDIDITGMSRSDILALTLFVGRSNDGSVSVDDLITGPMTMDVTYDATPCGYSVGNRVFNDADNDGVRDTGETGIDGVTVELLDNLNAVELSTTTAGGGYYCFSGRTAGTYSVRITAPSGYVSSTDVGTTANPNSDQDDDDNGPGATGSTITSGSITLGGESEPTSEADLSGGACNTLDNRANATVDFGLYQTPVVITPVKYCIGNVVWIDTDKDGVIDTSESRIPNADVYLYDSSNTSTAIATLKTDSDGAFKFCNLDAGTYVLGVAIPGGYTVTIEGGDPNVSSSNSDNNGSVVLGTIVYSKAIVLNSSTPGINGSNEVLTIGFGFYQSGLSYTGTNITIIGAALSAATIMSAFYLRKWSLSTKYRR